MRAKLGTLAFALYAAAQLFASFPGEFLPEALQPARVKLHVALRQIGLSPGLEVFNGRLPQLVPKHMCLVALAEGPGGARASYLTEPCRPPTVRIVEKTFDGFLALEVVSATYYHETPGGAERLNAVAKMLCQSKLFAAGEAERVALAGRATRRDYATNAVSETTFWPLIWNCRTEMRENVPPNAQLTLAFESALAHAGRP